MRRSRMVAVAGVAALATSALGTVATSASAHESSASASSERTRYAVLAEEGTDASALADRLERAGATVTSVNTDIGLVSVESTTAGFAASARSLSGVAAAATDGVVGRAPDTGRVGDEVTRENQAATARTAARSSAARDRGRGPKGTATDPLDGYLWGMDMINAPQAHRTETGDRRVRVGIMDTGVDGSHPDLAPNFDRRLSRNFVTDQPDIDGECEYAGCVDPVDHDDNGHGTHVAGTIGAALNGIGVSGVAPDVDLVNVRAGQDSGYFFLTPTVDALTYSGDAGIDVVNMSFYVDPWLYTCAGGAPEDSPEEAAEQDLIIQSMTRALRYAHRKGVTLVAALGNNHEDVANPRTDTSSPDYPGGTEHPRTIDNDTCFDLPVEGPYVLGVSALGPSERKADFSNYTTDLRSGEIEVSAPGGWYRDGVGTDSYATNENLILSAAPLNVMQAEGQVDENGDITPLGEAYGTMKDCRTVRGHGHGRGEEVCGYYQYLQGTSMASPHAAGVAALAVSAHGRTQGRGGFGLAPDTVRSIVMRTATDHACPAGGTMSYTDVGRSPEYTAQCVGGPAFNGFYGAGIVNAAGVVARTHGHHR
ncbi:S8 family serine peptidase [Phycicoccus endophyticus]|uniref:S8 family serine peptidase n=1 Tax=Phycicoccus endophyticus TaxID=1690220 RepID=A0A7G9R1N3_9MICO|nr:S8 family serine peptidase [Phycicoccus endophyticus]NHI18703.1 S8 family serine peptidase [Phycicoccus endophyticus]QNN49508.1 S8 family serine peptidase [Phycicoccus endophyticus]GGL37080.1 serine protease [Phycicoccus endophyticus]